MPTHVAPQKAPAAQQAAPAKGEAPPAAAPRLGNRALGRLLRAATRPAPPAGPLRVSDPGDEVEREADRVADHVMRMTAPAASPALQRKCEACDEKELRREADAGGPAVAPPEVNAVLVSQGRPLDDATRGFFEPRMGLDLSAVRVHDDARAAASAEAVGARAYAVGSDVVFNAGEHAPHTDAGRRLLAHELAHVGQSSAGLHRAPQGDGVADAGAPATPVAGAAADFMGVPLSEDPKQVRVELEAKIAKKGSNEPEMFLRRFELYVGAEIEVSGGVPDDPEYARRRHMRDAILPVVRSIVVELRAEKVNFLTEFEGQAKEVALQSLDANELEAKTEAVRYGITEKQITKWMAVSDGLGHAVIPVPETEYGMENDSSEGQGLQAAAKVLLARRSKIEEKRAEQQRHVRLQRMPGDPDRSLVLMPDEQYHKVGEEVKELVSGYDQLRAGLAGKFPVLAEFSELDKGTGDLERLSNGPGKDMAGLIGRTIADKLTKIATVRQGIKEGEVNIWRLPKVVGLTKPLAGVSENGHQTKWVDEKVSDEAPGLLQDLALLVFNLAALALAPATGGGSLVVAAGVNAVVAAEHVQDYRMQEAMAGSAFDKAKALSSDDPSLFWLAVEIVGVFADVGTAAAEMLRAYRAVAAAVKVAEAAKEAEAAAKALEEVRVVTRQAGGAKGVELAERVVAQVKATRKGEDVALKAAGATENEIDALGKAAKAVETEAKAMETGAARGAASFAGGEVKVSQAGHLFSCSSPCQMIRQKYTDILAHEPDLARRLTELEGAAKQAVTQEAANAVAKKAAQLEVELDRVAVSFGEFGGTGPLKGTAEHKSLRWREYEAQGGEWPYERWEKVYELNMQRATKANAATDSYHAQLGWGEREVTVPVEGVNRRLDIADVAKSRGVEYKTGYQSQTADNLWEVARDEILVKKYGWTIEWVFEGEASKPLIDTLNNAGIIYKFR